MWRIRYPYEKLLSYLKSKGFSYRFDENKMWIIIPHKGIISIENKYNLPELKSLCDELNIDLPGDFAEYMTSD